MKIFDCTTFYSEHLMMDVRFNVLNDYVEKFIVCESTISHSGEKKKLNFDINNYPKFKDKIIYIVIDEEPEGIIGKKNGFAEPHEKRSDSLKRIELSYDYMIKAISSASDNDLIILSDNDEIPNLNSEQFKKTKKEIIIFKQLFFYYKFNLLYDLVPWFGSKAAKKKKLLSMSWLRNLKNKRYPFWRVDTLFSNTRYINLEIINDGGWHFTNLMTAEKLYEKLTNFGHHDEFELSGMTIKDLQKKIDNKEVFFNHFVDKQKYKERWNFDYKLKKIDDNKLPLYLQSQKAQSKLKEWFD
jgi:beta-1,4-mannosyl-glycoprotein beta-1,4-N-acetylglucosaminyltransferase